MLWPKTNLELNGLALVNKKDLMKTNNEALLNTNSSTTNNNIIHPEESNTSLAQHSSTNKNQQSLLANHLAKQENNITSIKDTLPAIAHNSPIIESPKNETLVALNVVPVVKPKTIVQVITENDDEVVTTHTDKKKKGIWATASRALKNLNHVGVKSVNGDEEETKDNTAYAITLGGVSITHKAGL